jgi:hypothetical protein
LKKKSEYKRPSRKKLVASWARKDYHILNVRSLPQIMEECDRTLP